MMNVVSTNITRPCLFGLLVVVLNFPSMIYGKEMIMINNNDPTTTTTTTLTKKDSNNIHHRNTYVLNGCEQPNIDVFQVYNVTSKNTTDLSLEYDTMIGPVARILLGQYDKRRINILANVVPCPANPTQCVTMSLGNFMDTIQTRVPYALYGDENGVPLVVRPAQTGWQTFVASSYPTKNCTGNATTTRTIQLQLVPRTTQSIIIKALPVTYLGTTNNETSANDTKALVNTTCAYLELAAREKLTYKASYQVAIVRCGYRDNSGTNGTIRIIPEGSGLALRAGVRDNITTTPLTIRYTILIRFRYDDVPNKSGNNNIPTYDTVQTLVRNAFTDALDTRPTLGYVYSQYLKLNLPQSNLYYNFTNITIV